MPPTNEMWIKMAYWLMSNPSYSPKALVDLLLDRYPKMTLNQAWTAVALYRNEHHTLENQ